MIFVQATLILILRSVFILSSFFLYYLYMMILWKCQPHRPKSYLH